MNIEIIKNDTKITSVEDWYKVAPPKKPAEQWKDGRSAKELARFVTGPSFGEFVKLLLKNMGIKEQDFVCEPEAETRFEIQSSLEQIDLGVSGPRNHDLLMTGKTCVIGVEAKVSEKFGEYTVKKEWEKACTPNKREKRISGLIQFLSDGVYQDYEHTPDSIKELQYQLFTATVGTILEAKRKVIKEAIVLVMVFKGNVAKEDDYNTKCDNNDAAFNAFKNAFFVNNPMAIQGVNCRIIKQEVWI